MNQTVISPSAAFKPISELCSTVTDIATRIAYQRIATFQGTTGARHWSRLNRRRAGRDGGVVGKRQLTKMANASRLKHLVVVVDQEVLSLTLNYFCSMLKAMSRMNL
jgi:hypothetical protein